MERPNILDYGSLKHLKIKRRHIIPFMRGRPERDKPITKDDQINLVILLNTCKSLNSFLEQV